MIEEQTTKRTDYGDILVLNGLTVYEHRCFNCGKVAWHENEESNFIIDSDAYNREFCSVKCWDAYWRAR